MYEGLLALINNGEAQMNTLKFQNEMNKIRLKNFIKHAKQRASWRRFDMRSFLNRIRHSIKRSK